MACNQCVYALMEQLQLFARQLALSIFCVQGFAWYLTVLSPPSAIPSLLIVRSGVIQPDAGTNEYP